MLDQDYRFIAEQSGARPDLVVYTSRDGRSGAQPTQTATGLQPGHTEDGYRFKGGNPNDQKNWEKM